MEISMWLTIISVSLKVLRFFGFNKIMKKTLIKWNNWLDKKLAEKEQKKRIDLYILFDLYHDFSFYKFIEETKINNEFSIRLKEKINNIRPLLEEFNSDKLYKKIKDFIDLFSEFIKIIENNCFITICKKYKCINKYNSILLKLNEYFKSKKLPNL
jgi:hypothetical protein